MSDIKQIPTNDLMAELKRREDARKPPKPEPKPPSKVDWSKVYDLALQYAQNVEEKLNEDELSDFKAYFQETAIEAVFGRSFWPWANSR